MNHSDTYNKTWEALDEAGRADLKARAQAIRTPGGLEEYRTRFNSSLAVLDSALAAAQERYAQFQANIDALQPEVNALHTEGVELSQQADAVIFAVINALADRIGDSLAHGNETAANTATTQLLQLRLLLPENMRRSLEIKDVQDIWMTLIRMHRELIAKGDTAAAETHKRDMDEYRKSLSDEARASLIGLENNPLSKYKAPLTKLPAPPITASK